MKIRTDFVTNSSSSSFIISKDNITKDRLIDMLLKIVELDRKWYSDEEDYITPSREEDYADGEDGDFYVTYHYHVIDATMERPYKDYDNPTVYDNHFIVDNDGNMRYDWDNIDDVFDEYGIPYKVGYCD